MIATLYVEHLRWVQAKRPAMATDVSRVDVGGTHGCGYALDLSEQPQSANISSPIIAQQIG